MASLSKKENMLRLIKFEDPEYIPYDLESVKVFLHRDALFFMGNGDPAALEWTDAWGVQYRIADEGFMDSHYPIFHPLSSYEQLDDFPFPDPDDPDLFVTVSKQIEIVDRRNHLIMINNPGFLFVRSWLLRGMENVFIDMLTEPEIYESLLDKIYTYQETIIKRTVMLKPDIIYFGDDASTTKAMMMNPVLWRSLIKPRLKSIIDICKDAGCFVMMHCCGKVEDIMEDIIEMGVDILNPLQAGANDLQYLKKKAKDNLVLHGGINAHIVATADAGVVTELARNTLRILGDGGGYIACTDQSLPFPAGNIESVKTVIRREGRLR